MPKTEFIALRVEPETKMKLTTLADADRRSLSDYINRILDSHLEEIHEIMESNREYTVQELAGNRSLWEEYIDPDDNAPFNNHTQAEREAMIREIWPDTPESSD